MSRATCAAKTCYNTSRNKPFLKFFIFPKDVERSNAWAKNSDRLDLLDIDADIRAKKYVLCADHFEDFLFLNPKFKSKFRNDIAPIPTIFKNNLLEFVSNSIKKRLANVISVENEQLENEQQLEDEIPEVSTSELGFEIVEPAPAKCKDDAPIIICRLCASDITKMPSKDIYLSSNNSMKLIIDYFLPEAVETDGLTKYVCVPCELKLLFCYQTVQSFITVDANLRDKHAKEMLDDDDDPNSSANLSKKANVSEILSYKLEGVPDNTVEELCNIVEVDSNTKENSIVENIEHDEVQENTLDDSCNQAEIVSKENGIIETNIDEDRDCDNVELTSDEAFDSETDAKKNMLDCRFCPALFNSEASLTYHLKHDHFVSRKDLNSMKCSECDVSVSVSKFKSHVANHEVKGVQCQYLCVLCEYCGAQYKTMKALESHLNIHDDNLFCSYCGKEFRNIKNKRTHMKLHSLEPNVLCDICGRMLSDERTLQMHTSRIHGKEGEFSCASCTKSFDTETELDVHISSHSDDFSCPVCSKVFHLKRLVRQHMLSHSGVSPFSCYCGATFNRCGNLTQHMNKYKHFKTGHRSILHECHLCHRKLKSKLKLKAHLARHAGNKKPYDCDICGSQFATCYYYNTHMRIHTGERPYKCTTCGKAFRTMSTLKQHKLTHKNEFPHHCYVCGRSFKRLHTLVVHRRIHSGERPHKCSICERRFLQSYDLKRHLKTHAKDLKQVPLDIPLPPEELISPLQPIMDMHVVPQVQSDLTNHTNNLPMLFNMDVVGQLSPGNTEFVRFMLNLPIIEVHQPSLNQNIELG